MLPAGDARPVSVGVAVLALLAPGRLEGGRMDEVGLVEPDDRTCTVDGMI